MYYGLDIGGTKIELAAFDENLTRLYSKRVATPQTHYDHWLEDRKSTRLNSSHD